MLRDEIKIHNRGDIKVIEVQTSKAKYQGIRWTNLSEYQKRKYENIIFLQNNTGLAMKFIYI